MTRYRNSTKTLVTAAFFVCCTAISACVMQFHLFGRYEQPPHEPEQLIQTKAASQPSTAPASRPSAFHEILRAAAEKARELTP